MKPKKARDNGVNANTKSPNLYANTVHTNRPRGHMHDPQPDSLESIVINGCRDRWRQVGNSSPDARVGGLDLDDPGSVGQQRSIGASVEDPTKRTLLGTDVFDGQDGSAFVGTVGTGVHGWNRPETIGRRACHASATPFAVSGRAVHGRKSDLCFATGLRGNRFRRNVTEKRVEVHHA